MRKFCGGNKFYFTYEWTLIFIRKTSHLDSLWRGGRHELGNGLLTWTFSLWWHLKIKTICYFANIIQGVLAVQRVNFSIAYFRETTAWNQRKKILNQLRSLFLVADLSCFCIVRKKKPLPWVEARFYPTAVHNFLGRDSSNRMPHDMFADCDLSPLCLAHSFTVIPLLLSEPTQHEVSHEDSVAK